MSKLTKHFVDGLRPDASGERFVWDGPAKSRVNLRRGMTPLAFRPSKIARDWGSSSMVFSQIVIVFLLN